MTYQPLSPTEIADALPALQNWEYQDSWLRKTYNFNSFAQAIEFVNRLAPLCDGVNHHPDIYVRHRTVVLILQTHQANHQVTEHDLNLARYIDQLQLP
ncbi:MAG: 4a-hydroxytetrahydrobiopterin dehydratase [Chloroflexi bacterium]|nr:4a-hydroxytetrahydrobiopterin dehydratase [Chloroflexota bacterium]